MRKIALFAFVLLLSLTALGLSGCGGCAHTYDNSRVTKNPTCQEEGERVVTCTKCGDTKTIAIPKREHIYDEGTVTATASCETEGVTEYTCVLCGDIRTESAPALGSHLWGGGKVPLEATCAEEGIQEYTCTRCGAKKESPIPATGKHVFTEDYVITKMPTSTTAGEQVCFCKTCTLTKSKPITLNEYNTMKTTAISAVSSVAANKFGGTTVTKLSTTKYNAPTENPTANQHPRLLFTANDLPAIRAAVKDNRNAEKLNSLIATANEYDSGTLGTVTKHSSSDRYGPKGTHNCNEAMLRCITSKAFLYQIYGTNLYGYQAIAMMKQYITTVKIESDVSDSCRNWGYVMFASALVYDWCYDLMTATDRNQFICGVQNLICNGSHMEVGFPPSGQGAVTGHGSERQILRDYLAFALAIYDEEPTWYKFIGGRVYQEFVPVRNEYYKSGMTPQGISNYVRVRFTADSWSALLLTSATGKNPYSDDMKNVIPSLFSHIVDGKYDIFDSGDDEMNSPKTMLEGNALSALAMAALYNDPTCRAWAEYMDYSGTDSYLYLILAAKAPAPAKDRHENMDLILYNGGYLSQMIAHDSWDANAASTYMKVGERTTSNHDHADAGTFQIYYKGLLTGDSGVYDKYGSPEHSRYHQATVAHNGILLYIKRSATQTLIRGQKQPGESGSFSNWQSDTYKTGVTTGYEAGYGDAEGNDPLYAYIAGDNAAAYSETGKVNEATRRMLTVYDTDNKDVPMYFFVFDNLAFKDDTCRASFLLHLPAAPTVTGKTVTERGSDSTLVLQNVLGGVEFKQIGGKDQNYVVEGTQLPSTKSDMDDGMWGRVEILSEQAKNVRMLNVMYVTDRGKTVSLPATNISTSEVSGAMIGNTAAIFVNDAARRTTAFSFTAAGTGEMNYYVSGVAAGNWTVSVGGSTQTVTATEEGGFLSFTAPAGTVTLTPAK